MLEYQKKNEWNETPRNQNGDLILWTEIVRENDFLCKLT